MVLDETAALSYLAKIVENFGRKDARLYTVGGYVRNSLLNLPLSDVDVCSKLTPDEIKNLCEVNNLNYVLKGVQFGTVEIHIPVNNKNIIVEHTTFRSDIYHNGGTHRPENVRFTDSLEKDARRRDFTINAIYQDVLTGKIIDPTGGLYDIRRHVIKATSTDPSIILKDDGLRIMRLIRFACELGFDIDTNTMSAAKSHINGLRDISNERIRDELFKILLSDARYGIERHMSSVLRGLLLLQALDAYGIILPELEAGRGFEQKRKYHRYDVQTHMLHSAAATPPKLHMRLTGLLHDIGKPVAFNINNGKNMHGHDKIGAANARNALVRLKCPRDLTDRVCKLIAIHMYDVAGITKEEKIRMKFVQWGEESVLDLIDFRRADIIGSGTKERETDSAERFLQIYNKMKLEGVPFSYYDLRLTGGNIVTELGIKPGPIVGYIKRGLLRHCAIHPEDNTPQKLIIVAQDILREAAYKY